MLTYNYGTQILPHNRYQLAPDLDQKVDKIYEELKKSTKEYLLSQPEVSASYFETLGRLLKEFEDVKTAVCDNQPYKAKWETLDLAAKTVGEYVKALPLLKIV